MKKSVLFLSIFGIITLLSPAVQAGTVVFSLPDPFTYEREIGPIQIAHSAIDIYVENVYDPTRVKDWKIVIWVPESQPDLETIQVDYSNDPNRIVELELFDVPLDPYIGGSPEEGFKGFYADTWSSDWEEFGTNPVGSGLEHAWGNPMWVSFHFVVEVDPWIYIKDACIPEPATMCLLGLGALGLLRKRRA